MQSYELFSNKTQLCDLSLSVALYDWEIVYSFWSLKTKWRTQKEERLGRDLMQNQEDITTLTKKTSGELINSD